MSQKKISIVLPVFNESENILQFHSALLAALPVEYQYEIIYIDDGSADDSLAKIKSLAATHGNTRYLALSRNFGHQHALKAGIDNSTGDCTITMDSDLQHPPELLRQMISAWENGAGIVNMLRQDDKSVSFKYITAALFYRVINFIGDFAIKPGSSDFRLLDKQAVSVLRELKENILFLRGIVPWLGFNQVDIPYKPAPRMAGESKYSTRKMLQLAIIGMISSSTRPLRFTTYLGLFLSFTAAAYAAYALFIKIFTGTAISGWTSIILSSLLIGGCQLLMLGIIGEYLGKTLQESRGRPSYIIKERND